MRGFGRVDVDEVVGGESEDAMHEKGELEGFLWDGVAPDLLGVFDAWKGEVCMGGEVVHQFQVVHPLASRDDPCRI